MVKATMAVGDPQGRTFEELELIVNSAATFTALPREMLSRLGVPVAWTMPADLPDGSTAPVDVGQTMVRLAGKLFTTQVVFAGEDAPALMGMVTLGQALLAVEPESGRLVPVNALRL